jgi:[acyl-carrier-protein] S-malonyltransferase
MNQLLFEGPLEKLHRTENAQPLQLATSIAFLCVLQKQLGIDLNHDVSVFLGHSLGEFTALHASGCIESFADAVRIVRHRGKLMQEACDKFYANGEGETFAMVAQFPLTREQAETACVYARQKHTDLGLLNVCDVANVNSLNQMVLSGTKTVVDTAVNFAKAEFRARRAVGLPVSAPFHSRVMAAVEMPLMSLIEETIIQAHLACPDKEYPFIISNVDAQARSVSCMDNQMLAILAKEQLCRPVLWSESVQKALEIGKISTKDELVVIEVGSKVLAPLIKSSVDALHVPQIYSVANVEDIKSLETALR